MKTRLFQLAVVCFAFLAINAPAAVLYVDLNSTNPTPPYGDWTTAATNIQDAIDASMDGDQILVTNGVYQTGGRVVYGSLTNRVVIDKAVTMQSVSGPSVTVIRGYPELGDNAVRCVYLTNNATLTGFTLADGATRNNGDTDQEQSGGGLWCESTSVFAINCVFSNNAASASGGAVYQGTLDNCTITGNTAGGGGGAYNSQLNSCTVSSNSVPNWWTAGTGGGALSCVLSNCTLTGNEAFWSGGGANSCFLTNCGLSGNSSYWGGGADSSTLQSCVLSSNTAGQSGGGAVSSTLNQCILSGNSGSFGGGACFSTLNTCTLSNNFAVLFDSEGGAGGGGSYCNLANCLLTGNSADYTGGGANGGTLNNCTLTGNSASQNGGGAENSTLNNCTLVSNSAGGNGGGVDSSVLNNCAMAGNLSAYNGGGAENGTLNNCTLTGNSAFNLGGGADNCTLNNCIVFYNAAPSQANYSGSTLNYCCSTPVPVNGTNNIAADPQLTDAAHISATSPCIGRGSTNYSTGVDIDGELWANPPSIGCDEYFAGSPTGSLSVAIQAGFTNVATGLVVNFTGLIIGHASTDVWDFGDGTVVTNQLSFSHSWSSAGTYPVVLTAYNDSNPAGVSTTIIVWVATQPVNYVSVNNPNPVAPYLTWDTAATNIQDAVDAAVPGGTVWVTNGIYDTGGRVVFGLLTNRVALTKPITVRSVNGASVTAIEGMPTIGDSAVRCVYLTNGATLVGFTLTNGATRSDGDYTREMSGGGALCESTSAVLSNCVVNASAATIAGGGVYQGTLEGCVLSSNAVTYFGNGAGGGADSAVLIGCVLSNNLSYYGGGAENSTLRNCTLTGNFTYVDSDYTANGGGASGCSLAGCVISGNSSITGGGASGSTLVNCTVTFNFAFGANGWTGFGGGVDFCVLTNCIVLYNNAPSGSNYSGDSTLFYCDTMPMPANGANNITSDPLFADSVHISAVSPCRGAGSAAATSGVDIDGDAWLNPPSIGCDEFNSASATGALAVAVSETFTNVATGFIVDFAGQISGHATANRWDFGDGTIVSNQLFYTHSWSTAGNYTVTFTAFNTDNPGGVSASVIIFVLQNPVHYVSLISANPLPPYLSWATAATSIQGAADAAFAGGTVMVSNGVYQTGMRVLYGMLTNRVAVTRPLTLQSVYGAAVTMIDGSNVMRCLYLTNHVSVIGFTLQNGTEVNGGGVYCESADDVLSYCVLMGNSSVAGGSGGGAYGGTLNRCTFTGNSASYLGGGANGCTLNFCVLSNNASAVNGGAAAWCAINNSIISSNRASSGGGVNGGTENNCLFIGNAADNDGGGAIYSILNNCTVVSNSASYGAGVSDGSTVNNSIVYYNSPDNYIGYFYGITLNNCCTTPDPGGTGDITNAPLFVNLAGGDFHLQSNSPCINSGNNAYVSVTNDLDGNPRIVNGTVDIGAYEYQTPTSIISYAWLQQYGLPTDGSADYADYDGTGMNNWQKWIAGLNPTNPASVLVMLTAVSTNNPPGLVVSWQSVNGITYYLQSNTNLAAQPDFSTIQSNIVGQAGTTTYTDTNAVGNGPYFYRVGVQQ